MTLYKNIENIFFLGIGGIGMSALAQYFMLNDFEVAGYDKTPGLMTHKLIELGIQVSFDDDPNKLPQEFLETTNTLVIYTPAVPQDLALFQYFKNQGFEMRKRAVVLGEVTREMPTLAVAGTHGKTTTSAILAHLMVQSGYAVTAFLGGVCENYDSNFIYKGKEVCVVEADEYDRSFLQLSPDYAAINSMDADHLDIYNEPAEMEASFKEFAQKLPSSDRLFFRVGLPLIGQRIGVGEEEADISVKEITIKEGAYHFNLKYKNNRFEDFEFNMPGIHNLRNAATALGMALAFGASEKDLKRGLKSFKGIDRRFSYRFKSDHKVLIEDYAHHPEELKAVYQAAREMYPNKKIVAIFQPHLYSRTRDFAEEFAASLNQFDAVALLPIYPAREKPIPGIDSRYILSLIANPNKGIVQKEELPEFVISSDAEIVLILGAGDIGNEVEPIVNRLKNEN